MQVVIDRTSTQVQCLFHHICSFRRRRKAYFWSYPRAPGEYSTLAGILQLQFLMKSPIPCIYLDLDKSSCYTLEEEAVASARSIS